MTTKLTFLDQLPARRALVATALIQAGKPIREAVASATIREPDISRKIPDPFVTDEGVLDVTCGTNCWHGLYVDERTEVVKAWAEAHKYMLVTDIGSWSPSRLRKAVEDGKFEGAVEITMDEIAESLANYAENPTSKRQNRSRLLAGGEFMIQAFDYLPDERFPLRNQNQMHYLRQGATPHMKAQG